MKFFAFTSSIIILTGRIIFEANYEDDLSEYDDVFILLYGLVLLSGVSNFHFLRVNLKKTIFFLKNFCIKNKD